MKKNLEIKSTK